MEDKKHANEIYHKLNEEEREAAKKIFVELINLVDGKPVSRPVNLVQFLDGETKESTFALGKGCDF